jgi:DNA invertase Pin-like site-specific DNA recombinase
MIPAYAYIRVSSPGQADARDGLTRQHVAIEAYAQKAGYQIVAEYQDVTSGTNDLDARAAMATMFEAIRTGEVRVILIEKLDRLARDLMVQESIITDALKYRSTIVSTMEPDLCSNDPSRKFIRQVLGAMAEYERAMISYRMKSARDRIRAATGRCEGRKRYGYYPGETTTIAVVLMLRGQGMNLSSIADYLNRNNVPTRMHRKWSPWMVDLILRREGTR